MGNTEKPAPPVETKVEEKEASPPSPEPMGQQEYADTLNTEQRKLVAGSNEARERILRLTGDENAPEVAALNKKIATDLLSLTNAMAASLNAKGMSLLNIKFRIQQEIGGIFNLKIQQEVLVPTVPSNPLPDQKAELSKTKVEATGSAVPLVLGMEEYENKPARKLYLGYQLKGDTMSVTFLGEHEEVQKTDEAGKVSGESAIAGRLLANAKLSENMTLFANLKLGGLNKPEELSVKDFEGLLGINLPYDQTIAVSVTPGKEEAGLSYIGRF